MGNFLTSSQVGCFAAPEWVLTFNLPKKIILIQNLKLFNNNRNGFKNQTKLQGGVRGLDQQADQHGVLRQLRVHVHVHLLRQGRCGFLWHGGLLQEVLRRGEGAWGEVDQVSKQKRRKGRSSRTLLSPVQWNGEPLLMLWKQLWNWKR